MVAVIKYQSLWALFERQPEEREALRYMSRKQLALAMLWLSSIEACVKQDINQISRKRNRDKKYYIKKQELNEKSDALTDERNDVLTDPLTVGTDKIILYNRKEIDKEKNIETSISKAENEPPSEPVLKPPTKGCRLSHSEYWLDLSSPQKCPVPFVWAGDELGFSPEECFKEYSVFRDYWKSCPGQKGVKLDWLATWRNWLRKAADFKERRK